MGILNSYILVLPRLGIKQMESLSWLIQIWSGMSNYKLGAKVHHHTSFLECLFFWRVDLRGFGCMSMVVWGSRFERLCSLPMTYFKTVIWIDLRRFKC